MTEPLLVKLLATPLRDRGEAMTAFWLGAAERGTPLITEVRDGQAVATFVFRDSLQDRDVSEVQLDFHVGYAGNPWPLTHIEGTDVWHVSVELPGDFCGVYCFHVWDAKAGLVTEDVHEPWAASFEDRLNKAHTTEIDSSYSRNMVTVPAAPPKSAPLAVGRVIALRVDATHLEVPERAARLVAEGDGQWEVWAYVPSPECCVERLPCVLLMEGQFLEHADVASLLDYAIAEGAMPPAVVVTSGNNSGNRNSWGWRNGYGPPPIDVFVRASLVPAVRARLADITNVHLVSWGYSASSALATAAACSELVSTTTLLCPERSTWGHGNAAPLATHLPALAGARVQFSAPTPRTGPFAWRDDESDQLAAEAARWGVDVGCVALTDPHFQAAIASLPAIIRAAVAPD